MGQKQISKWAVVPPAMLIALAELSIAIPAAIKGYYGEALIAGGMSFTWFHVATMCMKYGVQPWRVVPALTLASVLFAFRGAELIIAGEGAAAIMPVVSCVVWGWAAYKSNVARKARAIEAKDGKA